jgi:hypothetical protein
MDEMKWSSSSGFLGVLAANKLGFGFALAENSSNLPNLFVPAGHDIFPCVSSIVMRVCVMVLVSSILPHK